MNEMTRVERFRSEVPRPDLTDLRAEEGRLMSAMADPASARPGRPAGRPRRVRRLHLGLAAGLAAAVVTAGIVAVTTDQKAERPRPAPPVIPAGPVVNAEQALDRAATAADGRSFTPPRPDQWIYTEFRIRTSAKPGGGVTGGPYKTYVRRHWERGDGKKVAELVDGRIRVADEFAKTSPPSDYPSLAALPTDPDALLRWVHAENTSGPGAAGGKGGGAKPNARAQDRLDGMAFETLGVILRENLLPSRTEAAIFRAMKKVPGVTLVDGAADAAGRPAIALGRTTEGWLHEEVLLDPKSYAYLGERAISIKGHTFRGVGDDPDAGAEYVKKGVLQNLTVRTAAAIVDRPGQRTS